ncbi:class II aldolase and Adducin domain-containing protein [Microdochium bolleyi]|uniref:Class II aldolase and Adducin domain-containing protein n=1 Tax=Microdochium bolleyi TaxID=196109 RepID=A0A136JJ12_9PEZI|nr:class II aldolase and Adducin domain-containing protein [Microdochium bolleyi]
MAVTKKHAGPTSTPGAVPGSKHTPHQTPLEAISHGGVVMPGIPTFPSYLEHRRHILVHMAATFRYFARNNFTEGQAGHISVRDPEHPGFMWMNPLGRHFGMLTAGDMICLDIASGRIVSTLRGRPHARTVNAAGYLIHSAVHKRRHADVHAICHAHSNAGRAWSVFARPLDMLNQDICNVHEHQAVYAQYGGIVFGADEGENIADALGERNKAAILMNHGLLTVGATVDEAGYLFGLMDRSCAMQLQVEAAAAGGGGMRKNVISDEEARYNFVMASEDNALYREAQPDLEYEMQCAGGEDRLAEGFETLAFAL